VLGNTVLQDEIQALVAPYENRDVTFSELIELRSQITQLYIENGYVTSGAFLPNNQDLSDGDVRIQVIEGELERIEIEGLERLQESYVRDRLQRATAPPLSQPRLESALQRLQLNPVIQYVNAELTVGSAPGRSVLFVNLEEAPALQLEIGADNYQSPSIGSEQVSIQLSHINLAGFSDRLSATYGITEGLDSVEVNYALPLNAADGTLRLGYSYDESIVIEEEFADLDIRNETETFSLSFRQPLFQTLQEEVAIALGMDWRRSQSFILNDVPFSFSVGPENGESKVSVLRFSQDWVNRDRNTVLAARSQFSFGLDAFDATVNDSGTDGRFFAWVGQFQWVEQLSSRWLLVTQLNTQLTPDSLLPLERFGFGGVGTIRGYTQNQLVTDNVILGSVEARFSLTDEPDRLQLTPFFEIGHGWNNRTPNPKVDTLPSLGLGLRWRATSNLEIQLDYGIPLVETDNHGAALQDQGIYFSIRYSR